MEKIVCFVIVVLLALDYKGVVGHVGKDIKKLSTRSDCFKRAFGYAKACLPKKIKFCRTFTINRITRTICIIGVRHRCTSIDR